MLKKKPEPGRWERRTKTWFAVRPVRIGRETRWLRRVNVRQWYSPYRGWLNIEFVDAA